MIINYRWLLEDMFGYPKEVTATMTDEECREKFGAWFSMKIEIIKVKNNIPTVILYEGRRYVLDNKSNRKRG